MSRARSYLCVAYAAIAVLALFATWHQNLHYFNAGDTNPLSAFFFATVQFWKETFATRASASITLDLALFTLAAFVFMVIEAQRLTIRFVWVYAILGILVAISFTFPLFLIARERRLAVLGGTSPEVVFTTGDLAGLVVVGAPVVLVALWSFAT